MRADSDIALYGDLGASATSSATSFQAAKLDLFTTGSSGRWTFLAETLFEAGLDNEFAVDVERLEVGYLVDDRLRIAFGRFHAAFGYYNDAFHHGTYFMVPVDRPRFVGFEDQGGLIPAHGVGLHLDGRFALADDHVRYDLEVTNGRGPTPDAVANNHDFDRVKSVLVRVRYEPGGELDGLVVGANVYVDSIPAPDPAAMATRTGSMRELLLGAHAAYLEHDVHFIAEGMYARHEESDGTLHRTYAAFGELGYALGAVTPYGRYEWLHSDGDPYYALAASTVEQTLSIGVKHATNDNIALKLQAGCTFPRAGDRVLAAVAQLAFAF